LNVFSATSLMNVGANAEELSDSLETLASTGFNRCQGYYATKLHAVRPTLATDGIIDILSGKHPLLDQEKAVPLTLQLGEKFTTLLITGPNTGGKTVALKTVGLFALMTQAGLCVPAKAVSCRCLAAFMRTLVMNRALSKACLPSPDI